ncbi:Gfo/Idh/MocA family protein [Syntrophomonas palmitatica]|uniref:Gfo/Idh/MocA family protein n=1 Tax=Syntrophomonas palmitatica TaxID=402877 RepID=UPI0006CFF8AE|nr:Gfo/Idh/MocA family oxidoreductase [Syntrophomonas palmitatica]
MPQKNVSPVYNVLIIGGGQIGALYDNPDSQNILTHAHAFTAHPNYRLQGFVDQDKEKALGAARVWGGGAYTDLSEALEDCQPDIICLALPDEHHFSYLQILAKLDLKLIFTEKPLTQTIAEADEIIRLYQHSSIPIAVNYLRRFMPEFISLRDRIRRGEFGDYVTGTGYYGKGLFHNGSHMLDLLIYLLGNITGGLVVNQENDFYDHDPSASVIWDLENQGKFYMQNVNCHFFTVFEMDLFFRRKRLRFLESGLRIEEYDLADNQVFSGYRSLSLSSGYTTSLNRAIAFGVQNIYEHLTDGKPLLCSLEDAYRVMGVCDALQRGGKYEKNNAGSM